MRRLFVSLMLSITAVMASAQMSEEKIIQYVQEQQAKGASQEEIVMGLNRQGVTLQQLQQMRDRYEKGRSSGFIGNTVASNTGVSAQVRTRNSQQVLDVNDGRSDIQLYDSKTANSMMLQSMYDESMFLFTDSIELLKMSLLGRKQVFGHDIFKNRNLSFEPSSNIATPANYRLGPGDEVIIDIWGASQSTIREIISPDGNIMVEGLGQISLNGMTVEKADAYLKKVFSRIYSGLSEDDGESSIKLSLGQNRSIMINVMGDVENPGTFQVSSFATVFNALYMAGGPSDNGSLRNVQLFRNGEQKAVVDIYQYIMNGILPEEIRLEDNDVIMVPSQSLMVTIDGSIRRPMYYEMKENETLENLIRYAGGMTPDAYRSDVRVIRMGGVQREICTVDREDFGVFAMNDGDSVYIDSTMTTFSNMVEVRGAVYRPGQFQCDGRISTVSALVKAAGGLREDAFTSRALLSRTNPDRTLVNQAVDVFGIVEGRCADVTLRPNDVLFIPSHFDIGEQPVLGIYGEVMFPGTYHYADNTGIEDIVLQAGGFKVDASVAKIDVVRRNSSRTATEKYDTIAQVFSFNIDENLKIKDGGFTLKPYDEIYVRRSPGYSDNRKVLIEGEVLFPGYYSLSTVDETLSDVIKRAGMFTTMAYPDGARLERRMTDAERQRMLKVAETLADSDSADIVRTLDKLREQTKFDIGIDLSRAMEHPHEGSDIKLLDGDHIIVPSMNPTVRINGAVMFSNTIAYVKGKGLNYYISKAGGYTQKAKKRKTYVVYMNGTVDIGRRGSIEPGCEIIVPAKQPHNGLSTSEILSLSSTSASLATVVLALINLLK